VASVPALALAHPKIIQLDPQADAQLSAPPAQIRIIFNEPIEAAFAELRVFDTQARQVDDGSGARSASDPATLELTPPALPGGLYTVVWQVVGSDGHKVTGHYSFTILPQPSDAATPGTAADGAALPAPLATPMAVPELALPAASESSDRSTWLFALLRAIMLIGAFGALGGWITLRWVVLPSLPADAANARSAIGRQWRSVVWLSAAALLFGSLSYAGAQAWSVAGQINLPALQLVLLETRLGQALLARALLGCALLAAALRAAGATPSWPSAALSVATLITFAISGHAAAEAAPALPVVVDLLHLLASAAWVGGLIMLLLALRSAVTVLEPSQRPTALASLVTRFSTMALASVALVTLTGGSATLMHIDRIDALWTTSYGQALAVKLALFGGMLLLGAYHLLLVRPRFSAWAMQAAEQALSSRWQRRFSQSMGTEVGLAVLVLGCVGVLTSVAPPERADTPLTAAAPILAPTALAGVDAPRPTRPPTPTRVPSAIFDKIVASDDLQVGLYVDPASLGENTIQVRVRNAAGEPIEVQKVALQLTMISMDMGEEEVDLTPLGDGVYRVPDQWLSMVGEWRVRVKIRRADADDSEVEFMVPVGG
jgi:copper transport protein